MGRAKCQCGALEIQVLAMQGDRAAPGMVPLVLDRHMPAEYLATDVNDSGTTE